ncbi:hypothetical protein ACFPIJ_62175 [Dactylosporangium cerinum]|uniref:Uncharacterized protein n=1 Tax=Dactylosporangium cerinum TaxID=1434730 RepID=A0ABV9WHT1_9ACTN
MRGAVPRDPARTAVPFPFGLGALDIALATFVWTRLAAAVPA